jgi:hypothetical protein
MALFCWHFVSSALHAFTKTRLALGGSAQPECLRKIDQKNQNIFLEYAIFYHYIVVAFLGNQKCTFVTGNTTSFRSFFTYHPYLGVHIYEESFQS